MMWLRNTLRTHLQRLKKMYGSIVMLFVLCCRLGKFYSSLYSIFHTKFSRVWKCSRQLNEDHSAIVT